MFSKFLFLEYFYLIILESVTDYITLVETPEKEGHEFALHS